MVTTQGYSGKPLLNKLGFKPPLNLVAIGAPLEYTSWLGELPAGIQVVSKAKKDVEAAHVFVMKRNVLERELKTLRKQLQQNGFVWVSWPKKSSKIRTDITEDTIREVALPLGFVDIKVCAVSNVWSGLKLVIRREARAL
jgi:hypothetical protein